MPTPRRFDPDLLQRPTMGGMDIITTLRHFALVTYALPAERVRPHVHDRFCLDSYAGPDGTSLVWLSVVPFADQDFRFARLPWLRFHFGQTNYRTYIVDPHTKQQAVWFFGTTLDSATVLLPRYVWRLPWRHGRIRFDCRYDSRSQRYRRYHMTTRSRWAPARLELEDSGRPVEALSGFSDLEDALVRLTHPLTGYYYRRDGSLGSYSIWHDRLHCTVAAVRHARFDLLDRLGLVPFAEQQQPHSVLLQHETEFIIHLPPRGVALQSGPELP